MSLDEHYPDAWWRWRRWREFFSDLRSAARAADGYRESSPLLRSLITKIDGLTFDVQRLSARLTYIERPDFDPKIGLGIFPRDCEKEPEAWKVRMELPSERMERIQPGPIGGLPKKRKPRKR